MSSTRDRRALFLLRDTLLRAAAEGRYQLYWSEQILDEMERNLVAKDVTTVAQATRLRRAMPGAFPEATVQGFEALIPWSRRKLEPCADLLARATRFYEPSARRFQGLLSFC